jgi:3',5'-cyclic AMP phosphodiesterase CpdA
VSDLHFGAGSDLEDPALEQGVAELIERARPELVVVSGDLAHRGRAAEHEAAARYLGGLRAPLLVIPGNHDIPPFSPTRVTRPWREFNRQWQTTQPVHSSPTVQVVGINSVNPWGYQRGRVSAAELERAAGELRRAEPGALRVVALHHQLTGAPWRLRKLPIAGRSRVLARLAGAGAELFVSGHIHQATVFERRDFEVLGGEERSCVLATAPGLGRPRPGRRYEVRGVLVHRVDEASITVETHVWQEGAWQVVGTRSFSRPGLEPLDQRPERAR